MKKKIIIAISALALCAIAVLTAVLSAYQKKAYADEDPIVFIVMAGRNRTWEVARRIKADVAKLLVESGADINAKREYDGKTALMQAAKYNAIDVARLLIESGADINAKDNDGKTALAFATENEAEEHNATDMIALLKAAGAKE